MLKQDHAYRFESNIVYIMIEWNFHNDGKLVSIPHDDIGISTNFIRSKSAVYHDSHA